MDTAAPHMATPAWLWMALLAPVLLALLEARAARKRRRDLECLASPGVLDAMLTFHSPGRARLKLVLRIIAVAFLGIGLARPQWGVLEERSETLGDDLVFLLDCSRSMLAQDVKPSRLERAKLALEDFARRFARGRLGLVAFAGQAFVQCPLTFDHDAFVDALHAVDDRSVPVQGTDIGRALREGFAAAEKNGRRKILVLISDGEDLEKTALTTARELSGKDARVFTVGVGTLAGGELPVPGASGRIEPLRNQQGQPVRSRLDEPGLRAIAEAAHGIYQPLGALGDGLEQIGASLGEPNGLARLVSTRREGVDRFHFPTAVALVLFIGESLLSGRRAARRMRRAPALGGGSSGTKTLSLGAMAMLLVPVLASELRGAVVGTGADPGLPKSARVLFNRGTEHLRLGRLREAEAFLEAAVTTNEESVQALALYNLGHTRFRAGRELLKGVPTSSVLEGRSEDALKSADEALKSVEAALGGVDPRAALAAYRSGRTASKALRKLAEAAKGSIDAFEVAGLRWRRAADDFRSARELRGSYTNAEINAGIIDARVADLTAELWRSQEVRNALAVKKDELQKRLDVLKRRLPPEESKGEGGADDEDSKEPSRSSKPDDRQEQGQDGRETALSPEEAMRLLSSLHLDLSRQYSAGGKSQQDLDRATRTW